ncbi:agmatine deiminase family protein [Candidatus Peregrinibacteria bacterium]|nr:agmatine deiminase family protein [Candidatus Peregrinibacteria bacterium]
MTKSPKALGFRMPAEWEPHAATWLTWPHNENHWPGKFEKIPPIWAQMVRELSTGEDVHILVHSSEVQKNAEAELKRAGVTSSRVFLHRFKNNYSWARDHGPIFLKRSGSPERSRGGQKEESMITNWTFNGWGNKWPHDLDDQVPSFVSKLTGIKEVQMPMVLEGGSIDTNGKGTLLTTSSCLLHPNRNPGMTKEQIEENLKEYLGMTQVLWLDHGIAGDDTNGHIDDMSRFIGPKTVYTVVEENPEDENYAGLEENRTSLEQMKDQEGNALEVIAVPQPAPIYYQGMRLPASYANFYIGNDAVLLPVFNDPHDAFAIETLKKAFPTRRIVGINAVDLIWGFGAFHCVTQQQPA